MFNTKGGMVFFVIFSFFSSASVFGKDKTEKGICRAIQGQKLTEQERIICLRAQVLDAEKSEKEAVNQLKTLGTSSEKQAVHDVESEKKMLARYANRRAKIIQNANIVGCREKVEANYVAMTDKGITIPGYTVISNKAYVIDDNGILLSTEAVLTNFLGAWHAPYISVRFMDPRSNGELTDIEATDYGLVVKNLCVGGRVTVHRQFQYGKDAGNLTYNYKAMGVQSGGFQNGPSYFMYIDINGNGTPPPDKTYDWTIQIPK